MFKRNIVTSRYNWWLKIYNEQFPNTVVLNCYYRWHIRIESCKNCTMQLFSKCFFVKLLLDWFVLPHWFKEIKFNRIVVSLMCFAAMFWTQLLNRAAFKESKCVARLIKTFFRWFYTRQFSIKKMFSIVFNLRKVILTCF